MSEPQQPLQPGQPYGAPGQPYGAPGQPYSSPGQPYRAPAQPYGAPPQASGEQPNGTPPYGGTASPHSGNTLGRTAFIVAVVSAGFGILFRLFVPFFYMSGNFDAAQVAEGLVALLVVLGSGAAVVLAIAALRRPAPHLLAALALGIAGSTLLGSLVAWASNLFYNFL